MNAEAKPDGGWIAVPQPGEIWRHAHGDTVEIIMHATNKGGGLSVIYRKQETNETKVRSLASFVRRIPLDSQNLQGPWARRYSKVTP